MLAKWIPWRFLVRRTARRYGFADPATLLARLKQFAQPSEVAAPVELLRSGVIFHARGAVNTQAIQNNLDWVWPFWVQRQFNPADPAFLPRGFAISHVNLTHRNWTAVGRPDNTHYPVIDPRGMVTPLHDGWSLEFSIMGSDGPRLISPKADLVHQRYLFDEDELILETLLRVDDLTLRSRVWLDGDEGSDGCLRISLSATGMRESDWIGVAVRPYNTEGIQFVDTVTSGDAGSVLHVNKETNIRFPVLPAEVRTSTYAEGDVYHKRMAQGAADVRCPAGMASALALFSAMDLPTDGLSVSIPLEGRPLLRDARSKRAPEPAEAQIRTWPEARAGSARLQVPDARTQEVFEAARHALIMLSASEPVPGPYTYRRFWYRDAALMLNGLHALGMDDRAHRCLKAFFDGQQSSGYFQSQEGEWDANGQVLWILSQHSRLTGTSFLPGFRDELRRAVRWLDRKRLPPGDDERASGLLPAGFSAEHFGPNDFYYWDNLWAVAGLRGVGEMARQSDDSELEREAVGLADAYWSALQTSWNGLDPERLGEAVPAAPGRRMDAGAVGVLCTDYPLQLTPPGDSRMLATLAWLEANSFFEGGFFQDMIHSGTNAYLTLMLAQTRLRADQPEVFRERVLAVRELASPAGHWPEAVHPRTRGGCMGDDMHGWAATEWVSAIRNAFIREEGDDLVVGSGLFPEWLRAGETLHYGPTCTPAGSLSVEVSVGDQSAEVRLAGLDEGSRQAVSEIRVQIPGFQPGQLRGAGSVAVKRLNA
ncbi:MAG: hypothetical protein ACFE0O_10440 [Opitutales bacterium]